MLNVSGKKEFCFQWGPMCFLTPCFVILLDPFEKPPVLWGWFCIFNFAQQPVLKVDPVAVSGLFQGHASL